MRVLTGSALLTGMLVLSAAAADDLVRVTGDRVNLRPIPGMEGEVVSQVSKGDLLTATGTEGEWTQVKPPEDVNLWVYGELVQDGVVAVPKLMVRGGPGINYKSVGHLVEGDKVSVRGEHTDWLSIAPPPGCRVWISSAYVEDAATPKVKEPAAPKPEARPAVHPVAPSIGGQKKYRLPEHRLPRPAKQVERASVPRQDASAGGRTVAVAKPPIVDPRILVTSREQGRPVEMRGLLRPAGRAVWRRPSRYRLVQRDNQGRALTVCYVIGDGSQLENLLGKNLLVGGKEYWVQGVRHPAITAERITIRP